ncbi:type IV secretory pathway TrbL component [Kitasatospora sp. MAA4]|nr:type IV secretory pathway TrbL component [Kitasatospora sp. MAA4]
MVRQSPRSARRTLAPVTLMIGVTVLGAAGCSSSTTVKVSSAASSAAAAAQSLASQAQSAAQSLASEAASAGQSIASQGASAAGGLGSAAASAASSAAAAASSALASIQGGLDATGDVTLGEVSAGADGRSDVTVFVTNHQTSANHYTVQVDFKDASGSLLDATVVTVPSLAAGQTADVTARSNRTLSGTVKASVGAALRY